MRTAEGFFGQQIGGQDQGKTVVVVLDAGAHVGFGERTFGTVGVLVLGDESQALSALRAVTSFAAAGSGLRLTTASRMPLGPLFRPG